MNIKGYDLYFLESNDRAQKALYSAIVLIDAYRAEAFPGWSQILRALTTYAA